MTRYTIPLAPLFPVNAIRNELQRSFDQALTSRNAGWAPAVEVREDSSGFVFEYDLPGVSPESVEVLAEDGTLTVRGERPARELGEGERRLVDQRTTGNFQVRFRMPKSADATTVTASYELGVLTVRVSKVAPAQPRRVQVTVGSGTKQSVSESPSE